MTPCEFLLHFLPARKKPVQRLVEFVLVDITKAHFVTQRVPAGGT